jgi:hypothetical protein
MRPWAIDGSKVTQVASGAEAGTEATGRLASMSADQRSVERALVDSVRKVAV